MGFPLKRLFLCIFLSLFFAGHGFSEEIVHVMKQGETIYSIARSYGLSADAVLKHNKIADPSKVPAGAKIKIPGTEAKGSAAPTATATSAPTTTATATPVKTDPPRQGYEEYRVEKSDTFFGLARRFGLTVAELQKINGFSPDYVLKAGEKIRVPAQAQANTAASVNTQTPGSTTIIIKPDPAVKWPIKAKEIAQISGKLNGVQITGDRQESVKSLTGGTVVSAGPYRGFGRVAIVQTATGYLYVYGGCETLSVKEGDKVAAGAELGRLGIDTKTAKSQLFFFVYKGNTAVDPAKAPRA